MQIPAFNGLAQVLVQSDNLPGTLLLTCTADGLKTGSVTINVK
jgi:hypothetical protein